MRIVIVFKYWMPDAGSSARLSKINFKSCELHPKLPLPDLKTSKFQIMSSLFKFSASFCTLLSCNTILCIQCLHSVNRVNLLSQENGIVKNNLILSSSVQVRLVNQEIYPFFGFDDMYFLRGCTMMRTLDATGSIQNKSDIFLLLPLRLLLGGSLATKPPSS